MAADTPKLVLVGPRHCRGVPAPRKRRCCANAGRGPLPSPVAALDPRGAAPYLFPLGIDGAYRPACRCRRSCLRASPRPPSPASTPAAPPSCANWSRSTSRPASRWARRTLSRRLPLGLSPASIRNVMADLEEAGFLYAPHTSAGRLPTDRGLRLFVDGLLEFGDLAEEERDAIAARCAASGRSLQDTLAEAGQMLSGLAGAAGLVVAPKTRGPHPPHRVRGARPRPRPGGAGDGGRPGGEPRHRGAARPAARRAASRPATTSTPAWPARTPGGDAGARGGGDRRQPHRARRADAARWWRPALATWAGGGGAGSLILRGQARLLQNLDQAGAGARDPGAVRAAGGAGDGAAPAGTRAARRGRADLHRRRERPVRQRRPRPWWWRPSATGRSSASSAPSA